MALPEFAALEIEIAGDLAEDFGELEKVELERKTSSSSFDPNRVTLQAKITGISQNTFATDRIDPSSRYTFRIFDTDVVIKKGDRLWIGNQKHDVTGGKRVGRLDDGSEYLHPVYTN